MLQHTPGNRGGRRRGVLLLLALVTGALLPSAAAAAGDPAAGRAKAQLCVNCHGIDGRSRRPDAPNIAGQVRRYLVKQLRAFRDGKRVEPSMSVVTRPLSDADIDDIAAWYASIPVTVDLPD